jgi:hypothetical protein
MTVQLQREFVRWGTLMFPSLESLQGFFRVRSGRTFVDQGLGHPMRQSWDAWVCRVLKMGSCLPATRNAPTFLRPGVGFGLDAQPRGLVCVPVGIDLLTGLVTGRGYLSVSSARALLFTGGLGKGDSQG